MTKIYPTIVVSGPPRSGTSLLMQMLAAAGIEVITDGKRTADEDNPRGYFEHHKVMQLAQDTSIFADSAGRAVKVIYALLKHIPVNLPLAVIFLERDLEDVLTSQSMMLERLGRPQPKLDPQRMRELLRSQLVTAREDLESRLNSFVLDIQYSQVIADPTRNAKKIATFLGPLIGKEINAEAMAGCVDASLNRQRKRV
jgi:hypothetical protein